MPIDDFLTEFTVLANPVNSLVPFSHVMSRGMIKGSNKIWICKEAHDPAIAKREMLAQEYFRLIIPHQPETRLLRNSITNVYYILSEEVPGYQPLPRGAPKLFYDRFGYTGLGQVLVCAMYLQETDLKNGNIGINSNYQVIKIDGDWCFSSLSKIFRDKPFKITPNTITALPYPEDFHAYHWLDVVLSGIEQVQSSLVEPAMIVAPLFRKSVNEAILRICLIPSGFITRFVDAHIPVRFAAFCYISLLNTRRNELSESILENASFQSYLYTTEATSVAKEMVDQMKSFQTNGQHFIISPKLKIHEYLEENVNVMLNNLRDVKKTPKKNTSQLVRALSIQLNNLLQYEINSADSLLYEDVDHKRMALSQHCDNMMELSAIMQGIDQTQSSLQSQTVQQAKTMLQSRWYGYLSIKETNEFEQQIAAIAPAQREYGIDFSSISFHLLEVIQGIGARAPHSKNEVMLKLSLLPVELIEHFVTVNSPNNTLFFLNLLKNQRNELVDKVFQDASFQAYLYTPEATYVAQQMTDQIQSFQVNGQPSIMSSVDYQHIEDYVHDQMNDLRDIHKCTSTQTSQLVRELSIQLTQLSQCEISSRDTLLHEYIRYKRTLISENCNDLVILEELKQNILKIYLSVNSPQIQHAKEKIRTSMPKERANDLERTLCAIPLGKRGMYSVPEVSRSNANQGEDTTINQRKGTGPAKR